MYPDRSPRKWISAGLAVMFVLIGVATILSILLFRGTYPSMMGFRFGWFPIIGLFFLFIILKWIFFPWGWDTGGITGEMKTGRSRQFGSDMPKARSPKSNMNRCSRI